MVQKVGPWQSGATFKLHYMYRLFQSVKVSKDGQKQPDNDYDPRRTESGP